MNKVELIMITISAIASAVAAVIALIATIQNHRSIKRQEAERHAMVKPWFVVMGTFEDNIKKEIKIDIKNIGYDKLGNIFVSWDGPETVKADLDKYLEDGNSIIYKINLMYNGNKKDSKDIIGRLNLLYTDILGKKYNEGVDIVIKSKYYEDIKKYSNELENIINKEFD